MELLEWGNIKDFYFYFLQYKVPSHGIKQPAQKAQEKVVGVNKTQWFIKKKYSIKKWEENVKMT